MEVYKVMAIDQLRSCGGEIHIWFPPDADVHIEEARNQPFLMQTIKI